jgi:radical SAM protein with 4Fe4S-binding SPASM domain
LKETGLEWAEGFWKGIRPFVHLRKEDSLLILPPSRVFKLNGSGYQVLDFLTRGGCLADIPALDPQKRQELQSFFHALRQVYDGEEAGLERIPYDFDFTRLPVLGEIALTYRCNHACRFCYAGCGGEDGKRKASGSPETEMDSAQVKRVIDLFKDEAQIPFFSFTGGEPCLRTDLEELIAYAVAKGLRVNLISNGTLMDSARARSLKAAGLDSAQISIEAPRPELHDALTQVDGSFERALGGIAALQAAGVSVQTNTTLNALNSDAALRMPAFLRALGVRRFSMNLFIPTGRGKENADLFLSYARVGPLVDALRKEAFAQELTFFWYSPTPFCHYNPIARGLGNKSCAAMDGLISVTPAGQVIPCSSWDEPMGSLLSGDFRDIWFSQRATHIKNKRFAPAECSGCPSFVACQSACPLYWNYSGTAELAGRNPASKRDPAAIGGSAIACDTPCAASAPADVRETCLWK